MLGKNQYTIEIEHTAVWNTAKLTIQFQLALKNLLIILGSSLICKIDLFLVFFKRVVPIRTGQIQLVCFVLILCNYIIIIYYNFRSSPKMFQHLYNGMSTTITKFSCEKLDLKECESWFVPASWNYKSTTAIEFRSNSTHMVRSKTRRKIKKKKMADPVLCLMLIWYESFYLTIFDICMQISIFPFHFLL